MLLVLSHHAVFYRHLPIIFYYHYHYVQPLNILVPSMQYRVTRRPVFEGGVPFSDKKKPNAKYSRFLTVFFYKWYRFFIMACKQQLELSCLEWKSPSYFIKPLHVLLPALLSFVNLNLSSNTAFCVSAVRERLQLMHRIWVIHKFKQRDNLSRSIKIEVST
jgi:hypothetical protein